MTLKNFISTIFAAAACAFIPSCETPENPVNQEEDKIENGSGDTEKTDEFVILFTNDFHSQIEPLSKEETYNADRGGVKRIKALVDSVRAAEKTVFLVDAGDFVQGTYYFSLLNGVVEMDIIDELAYDVRTLGNHEFDKKMTCLNDMLTWSDAPVVASNYDFTKTSLATRIEPSMIIEKNGLKVGFIGLNVKLDNLVAPSSREGVEWQNAINVADNLAQDLRNRGADMVIALSHLGYEKNSTEVYYDRGRIVYKVSKRTVGFNKEISTEGRYGNLQ